MLSGRGTEQLDHHFHLNLFHRLPARFSTIDPCPVPRDHDLNIRVNDIMDRIPFK